MHVLLVCAVTVALGELGDKTQLLALLLACRYRRFWPIVLGITLATVSNHLLAAALGETAHALVSPQVLRWVVGLSFLVVALWTLRPDQLDEREVRPSSAASFAALLWLTTVAFFLAEMGDKTQLATALLAARFGDLLSVVSGTTLGMLLIDAPTVLLGDRLGQRVPLVWIRRAAALVFAALGMTALLAG
jgi:putative Ca2+/H+ antiporter (TMEM165/GDT1 family)